MCLLAFVGFAKFRGPLHREGPYWAGVLVVAHDGLTNLVVAESRLALQGSARLGFGRFGPWRQAALRANVSGSLPRSSQGEGECRSPPTAIPGRT